MKVTAPNDLHGRLLGCQQRAAMLAETLDLFGRAGEAKPSDEALLGLGAAAEELADELSAIGTLYAAYGPKGPSR